MVTSEYFTTSDRGDTRLKMQKVEEDETQVPPSAARPFRGRPQGHTCIFVSQLLTLFALTSLLNHSTDLDSPGVKSGLSGSKAFPSI